MCVIIHNPKGKSISEDIIEKSERYNPDGFGIAYLDGDREVRHTMNYAKAREHINSGRPYVAHYRKTTVGGTNIHQCHPFIVKDRTTPIFGRVKQSHGKAHWMFMNGTVNGFGCDTESDTCAISKWLGKVPQHSWENVLSMTEARFAVVTKKGKVIRTGEWFTHEGIDYSKNNVLPITTSRSHQKQTVYGYRGSASGTRSTTYSANPRDKRPEGEGWEWKEDTSKNGGWWSRPFRSTTKAATTTAANTTTTTSSPSKSIWDYSGPGITLSGGGCSKVFTYGNIQECDSGLGHQPAGGGWKWVTSRYSALKQGGVWVRVIDKTQPVPKSVAAVFGEMEEGGESDDDTVDDTAYDGGFIDGDTGEFDDEAFELSSAYIEDRKGDIENIVTSVCRQHGVIWPNQGLDTLDPHMASILLETFEGTGKPGLEDYLAFSGYAPIEGYDDSVEVDEPHVYDDDDLDWWEGLLRDKPLEEGTRHDWQSLRIIAVYGTLKEGHSNHALLDPRYSHLVGKGKTVLPYSMAPTTTVPHVADDKHPDAVPISVELYCVHAGCEGDQVLNSIDCLEGHPRNYKREIVQVETEYATRRAWLYFSSYFGNGERVSVFPCRPTAPKVPKPRVITTPSTPAPTSMGPATDKAAPKK